MTQRWLNENVPNFFDKETWPAKSPNLSIVENCFSILVDKVNQRRPRRSRGLKNILKQEWNKIPLSQIRNMVRSMNDRIKEVIKLKGEFIKIKIN